MKTIVQGRRHEVDKHPLISLLSPSDGVPRKCLSLFESMNTRSAALPLSLGGEKSHLEFGYWSFFGIWSLGFGASRPVHGLHNASYPSHYVNITGNLR